jgi:hypothetical protein
VTLWIPLAPVQQGKEKPEDGHAIHGIAGGDLADTVGIFQRPENPDPLYCPIMIKNRNPLLVKKVVVTHGKPSPIRPADGCEDSLALFWNAVNR